MRSRIFSGLLFLSLIFVAAGPASAETFVGQVVKVIDGDTIEVLHNGLAETVRLAEIDAPDAGQPYWDKARQFTADTVAGRNVTVTVAKKDSEQRTLAQVIFSRDNEQTSLNRELVRAGYAWWLRSSSQDFSLEKLEQEARTAHRGLWAEPDPVAPWEFRKKMNSVAKSPPQWLLTSLASGLFALFAAFFGAGAALAGRWGQEKRMAQKGDFLAGLTASIALQDQDEQLTQLKRNYLDALSNNPERGLKVTSSMPLSPPLTFEPSTLQFLVGKGETSLLQRLIRAQRKALQSFETLRYRNEIHRTFQRKAEEQGIDQALSPSTQHRLTRAIDEVYSSVDASTTILDAARQDLDVFLEKHYRWRVDADSSIKDP